MKIFIDTGIFIVFFNPQEKYHQKVISTYKTYQQERVKFYTSYYVLCELFTRLTYDFGRKITERAISEIFLSIEKKHFTVLEIDNEIFNESLKVILKFAEHKISVTDATSYVLCKEFKIDEVFTLDSDFKKMQVRTSF